MTLLKNGDRSACRAFTLLEMLAGVTIIAIIASIVVPRVAFHAFSAKEEACSQYRGDLNAAIERYMFDHGAAPAQLSDLANSNYYPADIPKCPADNTVYTMDPASQRISGHNH
ncbi:MAG: prepilin-type N-terminal cleavage/methylation domain-containing protein [Planctomycetes bacterium]|nr:prepilin-type N-terminal cleavage/methylation domain-containing protein [Planctomycetota bacterium]